LRARIRNSDYPNTQLAENKKDFIGGPERSALYTMARALLNPFVSLASTFSEFDCLGGRNSWRLQSS
jgi:hypothetical protein